MSHENGEPYACITTAVGLSHPRSHALPSRWNLVEACFAGSRSHLVKRFEIALIEEMKAKTSQSHSYKKERRAYEND